MLRQSHRPAADAVGRGAVAACGGEARRGPREAADMDAGPRSKGVGWRSVPEGRDASGAAGRARVRPAVVVLLLLAGKARVRRQAGGRGRWWEPVAPRRGRNTRECAREACVTRRKRQRKIHRLQIVELDRHRMQHRKLGPNQVAPRVHLPPIEGVHYSHGRANVRHLDQSVHSGRAGEDDDAEGTGPPDRPRDDACYGRHGHRVTHVANEQQQHAAWRVVLGR